MEWLILFIIGCIGGTVGSLIGLGGGIIVVPSLLFLGTLGYIEGITPQLAVGSSILAVMVTGLSSAISYYKKGFVDIKSGLLFFIGSGPGAIVGSWINKYIDTATFSLYFGLFIMVISIILFLQGRVKPLINPIKGMKKTFIDNKGLTYEYGYSISLAISISFVVGITSGLFGIGGGALMVPAMLILFRFPPHIAVATSMFLTFLSSITGSITHFYFSNIDWMLVFALVPGAWFGAKAGAYINTRLKPTTITLLLRIFLLVVGMKLIYEGLGFA